MAKIKAPYTPPQTTVNHNLPLFPEEEAIFKEIRKLLRDNPGFDVDPKTEAARIVGKAYKDLLADMHQALELAKPSGPPASETPSPNAFGAPLSDDPQTSS